VAAEAFVNGRATICVTVSVGGISPGEAISDHSSTTAVRPFHFRSLNPHFDASRRCDAAGSLQPVPVNAERADPGGGACCQFIAFRISLSQTRRIPDVLPQPKPQNQIMKTSKLLLGLAVLLGITLTLHVHAQSSAFTYQGSLTDSGSPATGIYDLRFALFDDASAGAMQGEAITNLATLVSNGLITVVLDFGPGVFDGVNRWLEIGVTTNGGGAFSPLNPRQPVASAPYAVRALNISSNALSAFGGPVSFSNPANSFSGTFSGDGSALTNLGGTSASNSWRLGGNAGTTPGVNFIGTTDAQSLQFKVNNEVGLRIEATTETPGLIGGYIGNSGGTNPWGMVIAGGGRLGYPNVIGGVAYFSMIGGGFSNQIGSSSQTASIVGGQQNQIGPDSTGSAIGGGVANTIGEDSPSATIAGGNGNRIGPSGKYGTVSGGFFNQIRSGAWHSSIGGGTLNEISTNSDYSAIGGGLGNKILDGSSFGTIPGGYVNVIGTNADFSVVGGGTSNRIANDSSYATIAGGGGNLIDTNAVLSVVGGGNGNGIQSLARNSSIGGGQLNQIGFYARYATIAGGIENIIGTNAESSAIGGGSGNQIEDEGFYCTIGGGIDNRIKNDADHGTIGGGSGNLILDGAGRSTIAGGWANHVGTNANLSSIGGGYGNVAEGERATIAGGYQNSALGNESTVGGGIGNSASGVRTTVAGGSGNVASVGGSTVGGGNGNDALNSGATVAGGESNTAQSYMTAVGGGMGNTASGSGSAVAGGSGNLAGTYYSAVGGGLQNLADANTATVAGGQANRATGNSSAIAGGQNNTNSGSYAMVPGGRENVASGNYAFAAGYRANAGHNGAFVWADSTTATLASTNSDSVTFRASGGYRMYTDSGTTIGVYLSPGGNAWNSISDRDAKKNIAPVDAGAVLEKLVQVPVQAWNYKSEADDAVPHIGPMAQDFKGVFYPGRDDKGISTLEFDGVALAAIQGLNEKVEVRSQNAAVSIRELKAENDALKQKFTDELKRRDAENAQLRNELQEIKRLLSTLTRKGNQP